MITAAKQNKQALESASVAIEALADLVQAFKKDLSSLETKELAAIEDDFYEGR